MKKMKTLTVGADTYQVWDPEAARIDDSAVTEDAWSAKNTVDRLCPGFTHTGAAVTCSPVEGYPLSVVSHIYGKADKVTLYIGGKNLLDLTSLTHGTVERVDAPTLIKESNHIKFTSSEQGRCQWHGRLAIPKSMWGKTITLSCGRWSCTDSTADPCMFILQQVTPTQQAGEHGASLKKQNSLTVTVKENVTYLMIIFRMDQEPPYSPTGTVFAVSDIQLEIGDKATAYQPFGGGEFLTTDFGRTVTGGSYDWSGGVLTDENGETVQLTPHKLAALPGGNVLYSDTGDTTVTGRSDIRSILESLCIG